MIQDDCSRVDRLAGIQDATVPHELFVDSGTVLAEPGVESWRVSAGIGGRFYLPFLGPVPMAIDLAWPLVQEDLDQTQVLSFRAELPF